MNERGSAFFSRGCAFGCIASLAFSIFSPAPAIGEIKPLPRPAPSADHHYNPASRTLHSLYACMDGHGSVTIEYDQFSKARLQSMSRNDVLISKNVLAEVRRLVARFDTVSSVQPKCGRSGDALFVSGIYKQRPAMMMIIWSPFKAQLAMTDIPAEEESR